MANDCIICGKQTGFFDKRNDRGYLCAECFSHIPQFIDYKTANPEELKQFCKQNIRKRKRFEPTASLGSLYIDSIHKMFCISPSHKNDEPTILSDIYDVSELREISLYCKNPKNIGSGQNIRLVCEVEIAVRTPDIHFKTVVSNREECTYKIKDKTKIEWNEPSIVVMFRSMFNQMIQDEGNLLLKKVNAIRNSREIAWAEGVLMLDSQYTYDEVVMHHDDLIKCLHPDRVSEISAEYSLKLEKAFQIIKSHLEQKKKNDI